MEGDRLIADQLHRDIKVVMIFFKSLVDHMKSFILALVDRVVHHILHGLLGHFPLIVLPVIILSPVLALVPIELPRVKVKTCRASLFAAVKLKLSGLNRGNSYLKASTLSGQNVSDKKLSK